MIELVRRLVLLACLFVALGLAFYTCLDPLVIVQPAEPEKKGARVPSPGTQERADGSGAPLLTEEERGRRPTDDRMVVAVEGPDWSSFFASVVAVTEGRITSREWKKRFPSGKHPLSVLFFRPDESPIDSLSSYFRPGIPRFLVRLESKGSARYLEIDYRTFSDDDFHIGSGLGTYPHPPQHFLYPYRTAGIWVALAGLVFYFIVPTAKRPAGALRYTRWRVVLGDLVGYAFTVMPVALPILVVGGTVQGYEIGWPIFFLFGAVVPFGLLSLYMTTWLGSYQLLALNEELRLSTFRGTWSFSYNEMSFFQPVIFKPPRWFIIVSWIMVFASAGAARLGALGRAFMTGSSAASSIAIEMKNGTTLFVNISDQMGTTALKGFSALLKKLKKEGVAEKKVEREIRSFGFETIQVKTQGH